MQPKCAGHRRGTRAVFATIQSDSRRSTVGDTNFDNYKVLTKVKYPCRGRATLMIIGEVAIETCGSISGG